MHEAISVNPEVREVGVVFKTHLDIGFTDFAAKVIQRYFDDYIPASLNLAAKTRDSQHRFVWTTGSWLAWRYLESADSSGRRQMERAIEKGDFHWHALPFTPHCELMDPSLFRLGLRYSAILDQRFGRKTRAAKMTDVPGHTIGVVPLLAEAGVRFLHLGVNPASAMPQTPSTFLWQADGAEIVVTYDEDYGGVTYYPDGKALCVNLTGDNLGPQNPEQISQVFEQLKTRFPNAIIKAGGMDVIEPDIWAGRQAYPVVTSEIGDTWIHGVGTDPAKVARFHQLCRLRKQWIEQGRLTEGGEQDLAFGEQLLLVAEHTWGMDLKTHLRDWRRYGPIAFPRARKEARFQKVEASWQEQRKYLDKAVASLPEDLAKEAVTADRELKPRIGASKGWIPADAAKELALGDITVKLDDTTGAIIKLTRNGKICPFITVDHPIGVFTHQTFSKADYDRYYDQYIRGKADWNLKDFTKPRLSTVALSATYQAKLLELQQRKSATAIRMRLSLPKESVAKGGPATIWLQLEATPKGVAYHLEWQDKTACRMPEAYWFTFAPRLNQGEEWRLKKLGSWINPEDVVARGNQRLHAIKEATAGPLSLILFDASLVAPEQGGLLDFSTYKPSGRAAISVNLYNNIWGTNFPMWYDEDAVFRFEIELG
ncbi:DUF5054 domain-containing protein [Cerasicoccus frondis]|uniref:DUF5054 domain-containing protein n=1 Tax=Cerasicoccus frondis TaxID=490090 RepID=UPI0028528454|nr:DUF5054 domain-containing protein [Cerasicoccus frondis]